MIAHIVIANRRPCHSPSPGGEGELHTDLVGQSRRTGRAAVPEGQPKIARHFSAGISRPFPQVPTGRPNTLVAINFHQTYSRLIKRNQGFSRKKTFSKRLSPCLTYAQPFAARKETIKPFQGVSSRFKPFSEKKDCLFFCAAAQFPPTCPATAGSEPVSRQPMLTYCNPCQPIITNFDPLNFFGRIASTACGAVPSCHTSLATHHSLWCLFFVGGRPPVAYI
jgi:hypothetical protein